MLKTVYTYEVPAEVMLFFFFFFIFLTYGCVYFLNIIIHKTSQIRFQRVVQGLFEILIDRIRRGAHFAKTYYRCRRDFIAVLVYTLRTAS